MVDASDFMLKRHCVNMLDELVFLYHHNPSATTAEVAESCRKDALFPSFLGTIHGIPYVPFNQAVWTVYFLSCSEFWIIVSRQRNIHVQERCKLVLQCFAEIPSCIY